MDRKIERTDLVFGPAMLDPDTDNVYWEVQLPSLGLRKIMTLPNLYQDLPQYDRQQWFVDQWNAKVQEVIDFMNEELEVEKEIAEAEKERE